MIRAIAIANHETPAHETAGVIELDSAGRKRRRYAMTCSNGFEFLLDLEQAPNMKHGDRLVLEDNRLIEIIAAPEPLVEITASTNACMVTLAYHLGNRHLEAQLLDGRILIRPDHVIEEMVRGLGGAVAHVSQPFEPLSGAYGGHHHG